MNIANRLKVEKEECSMNIRRAEKSDVEILSEYDKHISKEEMESSISLGRVSIAEDSGVFIGWLRWNLFWDNTPFLNMLFLLYEYRNSGHGKEMLSHWEKQMKEKGYTLVMTSSLANEETQHFIVNQAILIRVLYYCPGNHWRLFL